MRRLAQTQKLGLRALMRAAGVDPATVDEGAIGFRLAPRINASGRLCRPESALHLLLTDDAVEAKRLANELEDLNRERQAVDHEGPLAAAVAGTMGHGKPHPREGFVHPPLVALADAIPEG